MMTIDSSSRIVKERSAQDFTRDILISLAKQKETPADIMTSIFEDVQESENEYLLVKADADISYSCSVGYDRKEEYWDQVKKYDSTTKKYYYEPVKKYRTVTDWQAFQGTNKSTEITVVPNLDDGRGMRNSYDVLQSLRTTKEESFVEAEYEIIANGNSIEKAKSNCVSLCFNSVNLPGDRQKDKNYSGTAEVKEVHAYVVPEYSVNYSYMGQSYQAKGFASGESRLEKNFPSVAADVKAAAKEPLKKFIYIGIGLLLLGIILSIFLAPLGVMCFLGAVAMAVVYFVKRNKLINFAYEHNKEEKKKALVDLLEQKGLSSLTMDELTNF